MRNYGYVAQDSFRKFLPANGGCAYIDLDHAEFPIPEVLSAVDYVAVWHATLRIARQAMINANEELDDGRCIRVLVNNSDGLGHSYGSHCNVLIARRAFDEMFDRKLQHLLYLAAYQTSSIVFTGQGKVGAENGAPSVDYQISQRADFFETLFGLQTTHNRPIVNTRDEALCGPLFRDNPLNARLARLHVIFYDSNLCHVACFLKIGVLQIVLAMIEAGWLNLGLILDDPVDAVVRWSHDPTLQARVRLADGRQLTAVEHQRYFHEDARRFFEQGGLQDIVPDAERILDVWGDVLEKLAAEDFGALAGSLDWILKLVGMQRAMANHPQLDWSSPPIKHLDHLYSSLDPNEGLFWLHDRAGVVEHIVTSGEIERFVYEPPEDTRAWTRAMLLRAAGSSRINYVDWDRITFKLTGSHGFATYQTLWMPDPRRLTRTETSQLFQGDLSLEEIVESLRDIVSSEEHEATVNSS
jgi:proteasome accessory factor A